MSKNLNGTPWDSKTFDLAKTFYNSEMVVKIGLNRHGDFGAGIY